MEFLIEEAESVERLLSRTVIVGGAGEVGRLIRRVLEPATMHIEIVDPELRTEGIDDRVTNSKADVMQWMHRQDSLLLSADCVVLATPEEVALPAVAPLAARMPENALLVDTLSVKGPIVTQLRQVSGLEALSLNPMFAPSLNLHGQPILAVEVAAGPRAALFLDLFEAAGAQVTRCDTEEHDRATGTLQALTHAALLSFGGALREIDGDVEQLLRIAPPPFVALLSLLSRLLAANPKTYLEIQSSNQAAKEARESLARGSRALDRVVDRGGPEFCQFLSSLSAVLGSEAPELERQAQLLLENVRRDCAPSVAGRSPSSSG